jgi:hypothetical protein
MISATANSLRSPYSLGSRHLSDLTISFGKDHVQIPEPFAGLRRQLPWRRQIGPAGTVPNVDRWLFPGRQAGRHIHP